MACSAAVAQTFTVVNAASFTRDFPLAPGSYAQIFPPQGASFTGVTGLTNTPGVPLPTTLADVQVLVNDVPSPLYTVASSVIAFVLPQATAVGPGRVRVVRAGTEIAAATIHVIESAPGIFFATLPNDTADTGGIRNENFSQTSPTNRARRGEVIAIFGTGQGPLTQPLPDGQAAAGAIPMRNPAKVFVSVEEARVEYAGAAPGFPGLWQINARVPDRPFIAGRLPVFVTINGISSNATTFWVVE